MKLTKVQGGKADIEFLLESQNDNETGFLDRFTTEEVEVDKVWVDKEGAVLTEKKADNNKLAARFRVVVKQKETKKATKKPVDD